MRRSWSVVFALLVIASMLVGCAAAAGPAYPTKQITYLVAFDPGGQSDRAARNQQPVLEKSLGQPVLVDYKPGGGGALGWSELARAKADGYLIAGINIPHIILLPMQQDTGFKTEQLLTFNLFQRTPQVLAVQKNSKYKTLEDFIAAAKAAPGTISIGGSGTFTGSHFAVLWFEKLSGIKLNYVPFNGSAPQVTAFLGGHTDAMMANSDDALKNADASIILAVATEQKFPAFPNAPTFKEKGFNMVIATDRGVAVPKGTPDNIVKKLEDAFMAIAKDPQVQADYTKNGYIPLAMGRDETKKYIDEQIKLYTELAKDIKQ